MAKPRLILPNIENVDFEMVRNVRWNFLRLTVSERVEME